MTHVTAVPALSGDPLLSDFPVGDDARPQGWLPESRMASALLAGFLYFALAVVSIALSRHGSTVAMLWYANAAGMAVLFSGPCGNGRACSARWRWAAWLRARSSATLRNSC